MLNYNLVGFMGDLENEIKFLVLYSDGMIGMIVTEGVGESNIVVIKEIYDAGHSGIYYEENGFAVYLSSGSGKWVLVKTPDSEYTVPTMVGGQPVDEVWVDLIGGTPTFASPVSLGCWDVVYWHKVDTVVVTTPDVSFIMNDSPILQRLDSCRFICVWR